MMAENRVTATCDQFQRTLLKNRSPCLDAAGSKTCAAPIRQLALFPANTKARCYCVHGTTRYTRTGGHVMFSLTQRVYWSTPGLLENGQTFPRLLLSSTLAACCQWPTPAAHDERNSAKAWRRTHFRYVPDCLDQRRSISLPIVQRTYLPWSGACCDFCGAATGCLCSSHGFERCSDRSTQPCHVEVQVFWRNGQSYPKLQYLDHPEPRIQLLYMALVDSSPASG